MSDLDTSDRKLEPFLLMAKSAKGAAAAKLIENATAAPGVFVFAELLEHPNVQELASNPQHAPYLELLKLFSYGTYEEYKLHKDALPPLNPAQLVKLKNLSLVTLGSQSRILPYAQLRAYLDVNTIRELEDLIIDAMYQDVLRGRLDQKEQQLELEYTMGRDLRPGQLEQLLNALKNWSGQTAQVIATLDSKLTQIAQQQDELQQNSEAYNQHRHDLLIEIAEQKRKNPRKGTGGSLMNDDDMDVDGPISNDRGSGGLGGGGGLLNLLGGPFGRRNNKPTSGGQSMSSGAASSPNTRKRNRN